MAEEKSKPEEKSIKQQLDEIRFEKEKLELEKLRSDVGKERARVEQIKRDQQSQALTLAQAQHDTKQRQLACVHRKGGKNLGGIIKGSSSEYSVVHHQYANGETWVTCTRCQAEWKPGDADYATAVQWPTDNEPSGAVLFGIPANRK